MIRLPGTPVAAERWADVPRLAAAVTWLAGPGAVTALLASRAGRPRRAERRWAGWARRLLGLRVDLRGLEHVDPTRRYVVAPLHEAYVDPIVLLSLPLRLRFVGRDVVTSSWPVSAAMAAGGHLSVRPERPVEAYRRMLRWADTLGSGDSAVVFPQGTLLGIEAAFSDGAFRLAERLDAPLLPVVISGTHRVWERPFSPVVRFGRRVWVEVLPPVRPEEAMGGREEVERRMRAAALAAPVAPRRYEPDRDGWWDGYRFAIHDDFPDLAARVAERRSRPGSADAAGRAHP
ncbi:MAG: lysophospholipid acyltransferase family protein [Acidimicrobiia bacterium]|nr:lysophospholipid acyltransferase family protein [Acidimicrobiia bacterium]